MNVSPSTAWEERGSSLLGRAQMLESLYARLSKKSPDNLEMIAPKSFGKSKIIVQLAEWARGAGESPFQAVVYCRFSQSPPASNGQFIEALCTELQQELKPSTKQLNDYASLLNDKTFNALSDAMEVLDDDDHRVLFLWDGLDKPLKRDSLTIHLWDNMRSMFNNTNHTVITATREPLEELITDDVAQSEFWNLLNPVHVEPFNEIDCGEIFETEGLGEEKPGAIKELINQTGGIPVVLLEVIRVLKRDHICESITAGLVQKVAKSTEVGLSDRILPAIWNSLSQDVQERYQILLDAGECPAAEIVLTLQKKMTRNGLARVDKGTLNVQSKILGKFVQSLTRGKQKMQFLFGDEDSYRANMRSVLECRLKSIKNVDNKAYNLITKAIGELAEDPTDCLNNLQRILDIITDKIIVLEFSGGEEFPTEVVDYWKPQMYPDEFWMKRFKQEDFRISKDTTKRIQILQMLTGCRKGWELKSKYCSKDTYLLLQTILAFRHRGQHSALEPMFHGPAFALLLACVELMASLARDLDK